MYAKYVHLIIFVLLIGTWNCDLEGTNVNPNDPSDVPLQTLMPPAQQNVVEALSGDAAILSGIFSQYFVGFDALVQPLEKYVVDENFFIRPVWQDFYVNTMATLDIIIRKAEAENQLHYLGVGKTLMALTLGTATSLWGDIPYSEAFQGPANSSPAYDDQEMLYVRIQTLLDEAIDHFEKAAPFTPGSDDLLLNWDLEKWRRAAYTLKARYYMHTLKRDPAAAQKALTALAEGISGPEDDLAYTFNEQEFNPWYRYVQTTPNIRVDPFFADLVDDDPREKVLIKTTFGEKNLGPFVAGQFTPFYLISYVEAKFLEAEALAREGQPGAEDALQEAVRTHILLATDNAATMNEIDDYLAAQAVLSGDLPTDLETILTQKYIAHFTQIEGWTDFRRTGFPALTPNPDGAGPQNPNGEIPRRLPYSLDEQLYNIHIPSPLPTMQDRFWWDK